MNLNLATVIRPDSRRQPRPPTGGLDQSVGVGCSSSGH